MKKIFAYIFILFAFTTCSENSDEFPVIPFNDISKIDLNHEIPIDSIVDRTEIIRFSSDSDLIIGKISGIAERKDNFYLIADNKIIRFDKKGKFVNFIGEEGKGPQEYVSAKAIDVDEANQYIYVMDYFGRKMICYRFDGTFISKFDLPENLNITSFRLYQEKILYTSETNSVEPEIYLYDQDKDELIQINFSEREMLPGEGLMGAIFLMGNREKPLLFHYFNDTVFSIVNTQLIPLYLLKFGKLKVRFKELLFDGGVKPDGPRAQVYNMVRGEQFTFVQYGVTNLNGSRLQTKVTGIFKNDFSSYSPSISIVSQERPLFTIKSGSRFYAGYDNSLLVPVNAIDVLKFKPDFDISEEDNSLLLKYHLR